MYAEFSGKRVLIVDDNPSNLLLLKRIVASMGLETVDALNGFEALNTLAGNPFDLVLLDIMMPGIDGFETLKHIRDHWDMQQLPVIMMSALDSDADIVKGLQLGANDYVTKPLSFDLAQMRIVNQLRLSTYSQQQQTVLETAKNANEMKSRLMRIASHDLKNPLNNLGMVLKLLVSAPDRIDEYLPIAERSIETMDSIINEFLDADILRDDEMQIDLQPLEASATVSDVLTQFHNTIEQKDLEVVVDVEEAMLLADSNRTLQVLSNLISNAIKYTYPATAINIVGYHHTDCYEFIIRDQGDGISADEAHRLFQPFSQLSTRPTAGEHSTGLGLWIVKQMVEAQGGEVGVNLDATQGAEFWVRLQLAPEPAMA